MVTKRHRMAARRTRPKVEISRLGLASCRRIVSGRSVTPSSGVNSTATIHDTRSATAITTKSVKVYSPAALSLRLIGMKPATVTSVPVSIGKAVEV